jgi:hypothetical protein
VQHFVNLIPQFTTCFGLHRPSSGVSLFWPKLLLVLPFVILLKFLFKNVSFWKFCHNFSHRITPVSLLCCRLLDHLCLAFAVTFVFGVYVAPSSVLSSRTVEGVPCADDEGATYTPKTDITAYARHGWSSNLQQNKETGVVVRKIFKKKF